MFMIRSDTFSIKAMANSAASRLSVASLRILRERARQVSAATAGLATQAQLSGPFHVAVAPDGSVYIVDTQNKRIRKVDPNGIISTAVNLGAITNDLHSRVIVAPDGSFITDGNNYLIKIAPNGQVTTLAGARSQPGFSGDGGPATDARFRNVRPFLAADGSIYISDTGNQRIRKISPDGIVRTIVGNGTQGFSGDGGPALNAQLYLPSELGRHRRRHALLSGSLQLSHS